MRLERSLPLLALLLCAGESGWGRGAAAGEGAQGHAAGSAERLQPHLRLARMAPMELLLPRASAAGKRESSRSGWRKAPKVPDAFWFLLDSLRHRVSELCVAGLELDSLLSAAV